MADGTRSALRAVEVKLGLLEIDERCQMRVDQSVDHGEALATAYDRGDELPPLHVFERVDTRALVVIDGFHREWALRKVGAKTARVIVVGHGSIDEARAAALGANATHGLNRTRADKRRAVRLALDHPFAGDWSDEDIADKCRVSAELVLDVRKELDEESAAKTARTSAAARAAAAARAMPGATTRAIAKAANVSQKAARGAVAKVSRNVALSPPPISDQDSGDPPKSQVPTAAMLAKAAGLPDGSPDPMPYLDAVREIDALRRRLGPFGVGADDIARAFAALRHAVDAARPVPCPSHVAERCSACGGRGWVSFGRVEGLAKQRGPR